jgi:hypothetical protein
VDRPGAVAPYTEVIEGCTPNAKPGSYSFAGGSWSNEDYARDAIDELFTLKEAKMLANYLRWAYGR